MSVPELVILGNLVVDDVVLPDGRTRLGEAGGATLYAALSASLWDVPLGLVSRRGEDYPADVLELLARRGVDLAGVHALGCPGARTWLLYEGARRHIVSHLDRPSHVEVSPVLADVPRAWLGARAFLVAPMPVAVQREVVQGLAQQARALVALDPNLPVAEDTLEEWQDVLPHVDVLFLGPDELHLRSPEQEVPGRLHALSGGHLKWLLVKQGARGGVLHDLARGTSTRWAPGPWPVVDPTGAGDSFAAAFLSGVLRGEAPEQALSRGVASAGLALEAWGSAGLKAASAEAVRQRRTALLPARPGAWAGSLCPVA